MIERLDDTAHELVPAILRRRGRLQHAVIVTAEAFAPRDHARVAATFTSKADPASVSDIELGLDTAHSATIATMWAVLLTGTLTPRVAEPPATKSETPRHGYRICRWDAGRARDPASGFKIEVYVAPEVAEQRIAAAVAAGGTVVDDSNAPSLTVIADQDGIKGIVCVDVSAAKKN